MHRRHFLRATTASAIASGLALNGVRTWAAPAGSLVDTRLLVVFLRGAYDASNVLVPVSSSFYYESRPTIAIARPGSGDDAALPWTADWALAPALRDTLYTRIQSGQVAFIPFAGIDDLSRSHFETQDRVEMGLPLPGETPAPRNATGTGFLNRLAVELGARLDSDARVMAFTDQVPLSMQGPRIVANTSLARAGRFGVDESHAALLERMYAGTSLGARVHEGFQTQVEVSREMEDEMSQASRQAITAKGFEAEATRMARMMRDEVRVGFVDVGGWDTHVGEGGAKGALASHVTDLSRGLDSFAREMGPDWDRTVVVVISEFGRTFHENGNRGTDHGHGTAFWVLGGGVKGGIHGEQVALNATTLNQARDWPVLNEYRAVFGGLFRRLYGLDAGQLQRIFPGGTSKDLQLV
ncbi:MAG TPA: DUF1501 domain-containing protein [Burkholderiaceae bacterium]|jgi:uncharacterized protein (DUF1501 family)|nr:DUF1501 domain-containing protein [Burkholderiaceae bacterium]